MEKVVYRVYFFPLVFVLQVREADGKLSFEAILFRFEEYLFKAL